MRRRARASISLRLLQAALLPEAEATTAWRSVQGELDLEDRRVGNSDVFAVLSQRLAAWGIDDPRLALFAGARRRNWAAGSLALAELAARVSEGGPAPVLTGRAATVAAYLPAPGLLGLERPRSVTEPKGATLGVTVNRVALRVPAPEQHLAWALRHRQWLDAAFAVRHPEMNWDEFVALFEARGRPSSLSLGLVTLARLMGSEVPDQVLEAVNPTRWSLLVGRLSALGGQLFYRVRRGAPDHLGEGASHRATRAG